MESMALYQDTAYDKLFRWTQYECRSFGRDSLEVGGSMKSAMKALKQRPVLFQYALFKFFPISFPSFFKVIYPFCLVDHASMSSSTFAATPSSVPSWKP